ncbi:MAG TPA: glycolate oxidase subunit GlcF [Limnochordales bacterium]
MQHRIQVERLGPAGAPMAEAVQACVHCGFCLATCPTYRVLGREVDSPRGRIYLMKGVLEGRLEPEPAVVEPIDRCLGCLACVTACPSGVRYDQLLVGFREHLEARRPARRPYARLLRRMLATLMPYPRRFRLAARLGALARPVMERLPEPLAAPVRLLPSQLPSPAPLAPRYPARGRQRSRVALLAGCVQQVLAPAINRAAIDVLTLHGAEVLVPPEQGCCGALAMHTGMAEQARALARRNLAVLLREGVDAVITTAAGCGSAIKEYPLLFRGRPEETAARRLAERVRDVSEWLDEIGPLPPGPLPRPWRLAYHDACHLAHAQGIREAPRRLLGQIPGVELVEVPDAEICCGSAGTYNVEHPQLARELGRRKAEAILSTGAEAVVTGNVGCMVQISTALRERGHPLPVHHTVEVLARAYAGQGPAQ